MFEQLWTRRQADLFYYWRACGGDGDGDGVNDVVPLDMGELYLAVVRAEGSAAAKVSQSCSNNAVKLRAPCTQHES